MRIIDIEIRDTFDDFVKEMSRKNNITYTQVIERALITYQLVATGHSKLVEVNPIHKSIFQDPPMSS